MSTAGAHPHIDQLRRSRSAGDSPRELQQAYRQPRRGHSDGPSGVDDLQGGVRSGPISAPLPGQPASTSAMDPGRRSPPIVVSLPYPQTRTLGGPSRATALHSQASTGTPTPAAQPPRSLYHKIRMFLGIGRGASRERRSLVGVFLTLASSTSQIITITVILALSGTRLKSPTQPALTEWQACSRPLGVWACIWVFRALLASGLNYWGFLRQRETYRRRPERGIANLGTNDTPNTPSPQPTGDTPNTPTVQDHGNDNTAQDNITPLPYTMLYSRLTFFSSLLTLSWFLTAHILEYTSIDTCRHSSPHIWWLTFGILCLMYLMVLEVVILGLVVLIVAPVLFLFWNIALICFGRHPLQTNNTIKPDIGKLPKADVDRIPLVMYIPPPPDIVPQKHEGEPGKQEGGHVTVPEPAHLYPPPELPPPTPKTRFKFIKRISSFYSPKTGKNMPVGTENEKDIERNDEPETWEEHWERGKHPFVVLEGNRAVCAICLVDFAEPKRKGHTADAVAGPSKPGDHQADGTSERTSQPAKDTRRTSRVPKETKVKKQDDLKLADAGEEAQPLRLLTCGHVFHKGCLDPWLTDVSGRCPVCQRAVELNDDKIPRR